MRRVSGRRWTAVQVKELRRALELTQQGFARELGVRQQTVSEWETGMYAPRGASVKVLDLVAEHAGLPYLGTPPPPDAPESQPPRAVDPSALKGG